MTEQKRMGQDFQSQQWGRGHWQKREEKRGEAMRTHREQSKPRQDSDSVKDHMAGRQAVLEGYNR